MLELTRRRSGRSGDLLGMHAFSLEENGRFGEAMPLAERAVAVNPKDAWAVHAIAHVLYETGENDRGVEALPPRIHPCDHLGYFRNHLLWHLALMHLAAGRYDRAAALFESVFGRIAITVGSDLQDSVALAWRLDLFERPDAARWRHLGAAALRWLDLPLLLFHDLHVGMALAASGDWTHAEMQLERLRARGKKTRNATLPEVVVPLLEGLHAFARGDHAEAVTRIAPVEARIVEVGGSHAQREVFHGTLPAARCVWRCGHGASCCSAGSPAPNPPLLERAVKRSRTRGKGQPPARAPERAGALTIRPGTVRDVPTILALIRGLADYERLRRECRATAAGVRRHGFGRRPYFETLIARRGGPVGRPLLLHVLHVPRQAHLYLEDLFVAGERGGARGGPAARSPIAVRAAADCLGAQC
jgi:hypothetical protein